MRKVRASGDGVFYLPLDIWPADAERVDLRKQWVVLSSLPLASRVLKRSEPRGGVP
jgi:hypothetical protein